MCCSPRAALIGARETAPLAAALHGRRPRVLRLRDAAFGAAAAAAAPAGGRRLCWRGLEPGLGVFARRAGRSSRWRFVEGMGIVTFVRHNRQMELTGRRRGGSRAVVRSPKRVGLPPHAPQFICKRYAARCRVHRVRTP